jgi:hypothetical protein
MYCVETFAVLHQARFVAVAEDAVRFMSWTFAVLHQVHFVAEDAVLFHVLHVLLHDHSRCSHVWHFAGQEPVSIFNKHALQTLLHQ